MGRPLTSKVKLKNGFYIELRSQGSNSGIKVHRNTYNEIQIAIKKYESTYDVVFLGEMKNGKFQKPEK